MLRWKMCPYCGQAAAPGPRTPLENEPAAPREEALADQETARASL